MEATLFVFYKDYIGVIYRFIWGQVMGPICGRDSRGLQGSIGSFEVKWDSHVGVTTQAEMANFFAELEYMSRLEICPTPL